ncbi:bifunctional DNA primase/polymerase [Microtetraspora fusca]|uniref:Bifunctional DNA primase/polymerase n=1 Tax=Microtetraspora fusca TaxID=1997 RepID=A0ABW6VG78_MICFU
MTDGHPDPLALIARGLAVFPLPPGSRGPGRPGWQRECLRTEEEVRRLWRLGDNIGIACWVNQLVGLDLDRHPDVDGAQVLADLCAARGESWPDTFTVRTPHGGVHLYFRAPGGVVIGSTSGGRSRLGPGIDTRGPGRGGRGGYLIGPGSVVDGKRYVVEVDTGIRALPTWLADLLAL